MMPAASYHVAEAGPLAERLLARDIESVFMVGKRWWPSVRIEADRFPVPVFRPEEPGPWLGSIGALVTFNDWGGAFRSLVAAAAEYGVPTFAKVEGAQDFADIDTGRQRLPYRRSRHILCQGQNDVDALPEKTTDIVGSTRLERIWLAPPRPAPAEPLAVINLNFTYGVLEEARDVWLATVVEGCRLANLPLVISLHPAEMSTLDPALPVADAPIRELLTRASLLISRFSTVPFEAMAGGVPFIYHNPHDERVPAFQNPEGAFPITKTAKELAAAIQDGLAVGDYRTRCEAFFRRQVDIDPGAAPEERAARVIAATLSSTPC